MPEPVVDPNAQSPAAGGEPAAQPAPAGTPAPVQPDIAKLVTEAVAQAVAPIVAQLQTRAAEPAPAPVVPVDDLDAEIALRQNQLAAIARGDIDPASGRPLVDPSYGPAIQSALTTAIARKEGRAIVEREGMRGDFVQQYNQNLAVAHQEFPELKDANSEMAKETIRLLSEAPQHGRIKEALNLRGKGAEKVDWRSLDARIVLSAAREAHSIITRRNLNKPLTSQPNPKAGNVALEPGSGALPTPNEDLAQLEAKAVASGERGDWQRYIKARDARLNQQKLTA